MKGKQVDALVTLRLLGKKLHFNHVSIILINASIFLDSLLQLLTSCLDLFLRFDVFLIEFLRGGKGAEERKAGSCFGP